MEITKEYLKTLHLVQLKNICKDFRINHGGSKAQLITRILDANKPITPVINTHPSNLSPPGTKIVGILNGDVEKSKQIGRQLELKKSTFLYYAIGVRYYIVDKDFNFLS